jgi:hypothetical protein
MTCIFIAYVIHQSGGRAPQTITKEDRKKSKTNDHVIIEEPALARLVFGDARFGWLWLPLRLYLGWALVGGGLA